MSEYQRMRTTGEFEAMPKKEALILKALEEQRGRS